VPLLVSRGDPLLAAPAQSWFSSHIVLGVFFKLKLTRRSKMLEMNGVEPQKPEEVLKRVLCLRVQDP